ncbi:MAG TPA: permease-like cell division protein FtsX [Gemmatimonadaceae bacterium]|nr:permease-like cell division protein FtsX [Gemmatimonadaceae bacterium]
MLALREAVRGLRRAPLLSALSVTTIAFSLFAFGLFGLVAINIRQTLQQVEERVEIRAFIAEGTPIEASSALLGDVQAFPEVQSAMLVSPRDALERARSELKEFADIFEEGLLPSSIDVHLREGFRDPVTMRAVAARLDAYDFVDEVRYGEEWVEKLYRLRTIAGLAGTTLGVTFAVVAMIIIGATIRMTVLARTREIEVMRLVGATDGFIRAPFLIEGCVKGVLGGACALLLTYVAHQALTRWVMSASFFDTRLAVLGLASGALLGLLGSAVSVGRHLRER